MTMAGVEMIIMEIREIARSEKRYWRVAVQAPRATPPTMPMAAPRKTSRTETKILVPMRVLMSSPLGVRPQSQWKRTLRSQVT